MVTEGLYVTVMVGADVTIGGSTKETDHKVVELVCDRMISTSTPQR